MSARDNYEYYKWRLEDARSCKNSSIRRENEYISQKNQKNSQLSQCKSEKSKKEKRLKDVKAIVQILEGTGGAFSKNVPEAIASASKVLTSLSASYKSGIKLDGTRAANVATAFQVRTVNGDSNSQAALSSYRSVKNQLEREISDLKRSISSLESSISTLSSWIRNCNSEQSELTRRINDYSWNMEYWRRRMWDEE